MLPNLPTKSNYVDRATSPVNLSNMFCVVVDQMPRSTGDAESTRCKEPAGPPKPGITTVQNLKRLQVLQNRAGGHMEPAAISLKAGKVVQHPDLSEVMRDLLQKSIG